MPGFGIGFNIHLTQTGGGDGEVSSGFERVYKGRKLVDIDELHGAAEPEGLRRVSLGEVFLFDFDGERVILCPSVAMMLDGRWLEIGFYRWLEYGHIYHLQIAFLHFNIVVQRDPPLDIFTHRT